MTLLLNVLWILLGGAWMAAGWLFAALLMAVSIVGLPWARSAAVRPLVAMTLKRVISLSRACHSRMT